MTAILHEARVFFPGARFLVPGAAGALAMMAALGCGSGRFEASGKAVTLEGELVDPQCWYTHQARGLEHRACAIYCARGGQDLAFMNRGDGKVYPLIASRHGQNPNDTLVAYTGYPVVVQGAFFGADPRQRVLRLDRVRRVDGLAPDPVPADTLDPMRHVDVLTPAPSPG